MPKVLSEGNITMFLRISRVGVVVACTAILVSSGCSSRPDREMPPEINAAEAGTKAVAQYDTDGNGLIGPEELKKAPALKAAIDNLDTNGDGSVSAEEITARITAWQESKRAKMAVPVRVLRRDEPVEGVLVRFVPEEFLGPAVKVAEGTTDEYGTAFLSIAPDPNNPNAAPGVHCGFYRVELTKEGANIPATFNTETTLGQEVANDAAGIKEGGSLSFEIK
jgi:hypothetical protein